MSLTGRLQRLLERRWLLVELAVVQLRYVSGLSLWSVVSSRSVAGWTYRTIVLYFVLFVVLILGGNLMLYIRSRGF
jgi:hypothetical protein